MARVDRLPPPPNSPAVSPAVSVVGEEPTRIAGLGGGPSLDARVHAPAGAVRAVVLCHPHPLYGGSMHSPIPLAIAMKLSEALRGRVAWVRFDFRGVGRSEGQYDQGRGEVEDARAAIEHMRGLAPRCAITLCGHSFGSWVALRAAAVSSSAVDRVLLIAPSTRFLPFPSGAVPFAGKKTIFVGSEDALCSPDEARALSGEIGAELRIFEGFDHHFMKSRRVLAEAALPVIAPELVDP